jgi:hypothetical protein
MINCLNINLDINPLREGLDINSYGTDKQLTKISLSDINHDLISFLNTLKLRIVWVELFYTPPFHVTNIHTDYDSCAIAGDYTKLNYIFGGKNSLMCWWQPKSVVSNIVGDTVLDSQYIDYKINEVDLIDEQQVKFPSIVQVSIPHNVRNFEESRYCLSLVLRKYDNNRLTMSECIEIFKQYLQ